MSDRVKGACLTMGGAACWGVSGCMGQYLFTHEGMDSTWLVPIRLFLAGLMGPLNIGYLFLSPYEEAAFAAFYRDVRDEKREIEEIEMQDKWSENEPEESENA